MILHSSGDGDGGWFGSLTVGLRDYFFAAGFTGVSFSGGNVKRSGPIPKQRTRSNTRHTCTFYLEAP